MCPVHHQGNSPERNSRVSDRLRLTTFRLKSFLWNDTSAAQPILGFGFVSDFSGSGVGIYLAEPLAKGMPVKIAFESETSETFKGAVAWSARYSLEQHFMGHTSFSYRIGIKFIFRSEAERQRFAKYVDSLRARALELKRGMVF